jgi:hypothetical protein
MVLGMNLLMGGLIMTMSLVGELNIIPLFGEKPLTASTTLSLILSITGFSVTLAGFVLVIYYDRKRTWYTSQMDKSTLRNKKKTERKTIEELLRE